MKKLVIILIALLSFGAIADAQVSVTKKTKIERLISLRAGYGITSKGELKKILDHLTFEVY